PSDTKASLIHAVVSTARNKRKHPRAGQGVKQQGYGPHAGTAAGGQAAMPGFQCFLAPATPVFQWFWVPAIPSSVQGLYGKHTPYGTGIPPPPSSSSSSSRLVPCDCNLSCFRLPVKHLQTHWVCIIAKGTPPLR
ncbi:unnamed protein product, partial [Chrysoparadoxa australica]